MKIQLLKIKLLIAKFNKLLLVKVYYFCEEASRKAIKKETAQRKIIDNLEESLYFENWKDYLSSDN